MPKRKHVEIEGVDADREEEEGKRVNNVKLLRLRHKFEQGSKLLFRALKTARGFERQKLGRRQKTAQQDEDRKTLERLEREVQALKALDLEETAERYLFKQLAKTKRISESPEFIRLQKTATSSSSTTGSGPRDPAEANVTARLFKSNPVQNALPDILSGIKIILNIDEKDEKKKQQRQEDRVEDAAGDKGATENVHVSDSNPDVLLDKITKGRSRADNEELDEVSMNDAADDDESLDLSQFNDRLASASDESDSEEVSPDNELARGLTISKPGVGVADNISISSSASVSDNPSESQPVQKRRIIDNNNPSKDTTFLPSLMMGGYWSGSESGADDDVVDEAINGRPQRKNRMGQQARRALWEKKYGSGAKHLQEQNNNNKKRNSNKNSGWDSRRGATDESDRSRWAKRGVQQTPSSFTKKRDDVDSQANKKPSASTSASLHPSWEAARKAKQEKAQASFQGKKITFD